MSAHAGRKVVELRRHTDNDGDALSPEGVRAAVDIGSRASGRYSLAVSTGAHRATQAIACFLAGHGAEVPGGVVVEPLLRSEREDLWRELAGKAGGGELRAIRDLHPEFVEDEARRLSDGLRAVFDRLEPGQQALVVGHSPTNEAAVLGLTGRVIPPLGKGEGVLVTAGDDGFAVEDLD